MWSKVIRQGHSSYLYFFSSDSNLYLGSDSRKRKCWSFCESSGATTDMTAPEEKERVNEKKKISRLLCFSIPFVTDIWKFHCFDKLGYVQLCENMSSLEQGMLMWVVSLLLIFSSVLPHAPNRGSLARPLFQRFIPVSVCESLVEVVMILAGNMHRKLAGTVCPHPRWKLQQLWNLSLKVFSTA